MIIRYHDILSDQEQPTSEPDLISGRKADTPISRDKVHWAQPARSQWQQAMPWKSLYLLGAIRLHTESRNATLRSGVGMVGKKSARDTVRHDIDTHHIICWSLSDNVCV